MMAEMKTERFLPLAARGGVFAVVLILVCGLGAAEYPVPDLDKEFIDESELSLDEAVRERLLASLTALARNFDEEAGVSSRTRAQAIAVGLQLNERHRDLLGAHLQLKRGVTPDPVEFNGNTIVIAEQLWQLTEELVGTDREADADLAVHLMDIATQLDKKNENAVLEFELYRKDGHALSWREVFPVDLEREKRGSMPEGGGEVVFQKKQSKVRGLLVVDLEGKDDAGKASEMNATASAGSTGGGDWEDRVTFNQEVGEMMSSALVEVGKFLEVRHDGWPDDHRVEISFENRYNSKDGPSAAVACALLLDSLVSGYQIDKRFAVTGDMNADGAVQPIGGVDAKIRGATKKDCELIGIPHQNIRDVEDLVLMAGIEPIHRIQIFSLKAFEDALGVARTDREAEMEEAMVAFGEIQKVLSRPNGAKLLSHPQVVAKLREVVAKAPQHLSGRLLLAKATGRNRKTLSLGGSLDYIDRVTAPAYRALKDRRLEERSGLEDDEFCGCGVGFEQAAADAGRADA
jgi:hypothetical protein